MAAASEVGIAPELRGDTVGVALEAPDEPVPRAVVIPMTMPDDGRSGVPLEAEASALVGRSTLLGRRPVEPTAVGRSEDSTSGIKPPEEVGFKMLSTGGRSPVVPITGVGEGVTCDEGTSGVKLPEVGCRMLSTGGRRPVVPTTGVGRTEDSSSGINPPDEVGFKMLSSGGRRPVVPTTGVGEGVTCDEVGCRMLSAGGRTPVEVGCKILSTGGRRPVEPITGATTDESTSGIKPGRSLEVGAGVGVGSEALPLDPGTIKGPRKLDDSRGAGTTEGAGDAVGVTIDDGRAPVGATEDCVG